MTGTARSPFGRRVAAMATTGFGMLLVALALAWVIEIVDATILDDRLQREGIHPRELDGLVGIVTAPLLHAGVGHLASNSVPLLVMGGLISARGRRYWTVVTVAGIVGGGGLVWLFGGGGNHIGASGLVFAYFGALLGAAWFERRPAALGGALLAIFLYSGTLAGLVPQAGLSWESHLFGFVVGALAARALSVGRRRVPADEERPAYAWELDEPWLD